MTMKTPHNGDHDYHDDDYHRALLSGVAYPGDHDVMLGRGGEANHHPGNTKFRALVSVLKPRYKNACNQEKANIARQLVTLWRTMNPPGRFLTRTQPGVLSSCWYDVGDGVAFKKATKSLGERPQQERRAERARKDAFPRLREASRQAQFTPSAAADTATSSVERTDSGINFVTAAFTNTRAPSSAQNSTDQALGCSAEMPYSSARSLDVSLSAGVDGEGTSDQAVLWLSQHLSTPKISAFTFINGMEICGQVNSVNASNSAPLPIYANVAGERSVALIGDDSSDCVALTNFLQQTHSHPHDSLPGSARQDDSSVDTVCGFDNLKTLHESEIEWQAVWDRLPSAASLTRYVFDDSESCWSEYGSSSSLT